MTLTTNARNAGLTDLVTILQDQQARKLDIVAPASQFRSVEGLLVVRGAEQQITLDGVTTTDGSYCPTTVWDSGVSERLGVPVAYLRRMRAERPDLYDANVNGWLHGRRALAETLADRVYAATSDPQALAHIAVVHALLATPPPVPKGSERLSTAASSLLLLALVALLCGTVAWVAWMIAG